MKSKYKNKPQFFYNSSTIQICALTCCAGAEQLSCVSKAMRSHQTVVPYLSTNKFLYSLKKEFMLARTGDCFQC